MGLYAQTVFKTMSVMILLALCEQGHPQEYYSYFVFARVKMSLFHKQAFLKMMKMLICRVNLGLISI